MERIKVNGLSSSDLKLPIYEDPYSHGLRPAVRRGVKAMPPRVAFTDDKPRMTEAATNSWLAVLSSLFLFASGMIALAALVGCNSHIPNLFGGTEHGPRQEQQEVCPVCNEPMDNADNDADSDTDEGGHGKPEKHGNKGHHYGQKKNHHVCKNLNSNG